MTAPNTEAAVAPPTPRPTLRYPQVEAITGLCRKSIYRKIVAGEFPQPVELGANAVGFFADEVLAWQEQRPRRGYRTKREAA